MIWEITRRNRRAIRLMEKLSAKLAARIPAPCGDWADTIGAYRFFNNEEV
ncbi:MAG: Transposase DNA-binding [Pseudomonadota bacterium]